jgi:carbon monoxide dehydrogenase subunit G
VAKLERTIEIDASPEAVYDVLTDPNCLGEWVTIQEELVEAPDPPLEKGDCVVQRMKVVGKRFEVSWDVEVAERPKKVRWSGKGPMGSVARATYELESNGNGGTRFSYTNEYDVPGGPIGKVAGRALVQASGGEADATLKRLKKFVEKKQNGSGG